VPIVRYTSFPNLRHAFLYHLGDFCILDIQWRLHHLAATEGISTILKYELAATIAIYDDARKYRAIHTPAEDCGGVFDQYAVDIDTGVIIDQVGHSAFIIRT